MNLSRNPHLWCCTEMNLTSPEPRILKCDTEDRVYALPQNQVDQFLYAVEAVTNADWGSQDWQTAYDELENEFAIYRKELA